MKTLYHESDRVLMVLFHKKGCSICRAFQPILERVVKEYEECAGGLHYVDIDISQDPAIPGQAGITGVPACQVYYKGRLLDMVPGVHSKKFMRKVIDGFLEVFGLPDVREWARERIVSARMENYYTSTIYRSTIEAQKVGHIQMVRSTPSPSGIGGWEGRGARGRGALGECSAVSSAVFDNGADENKTVRKFFPAFKPVAVPCWEFGIDADQMKMT